MTKDELTVIVNNAAISAYKSITPDVVKEIATQSLNEEGKVTIDNESVISFEMSVRFTRELVTEALAQILDIK